ncbi:zinc metalloprotease [Flavobacterium sp.]|uniref:zinc metalloprotease n=1 Tax=Flavobacterium sp. TaxID=239 RepID=UPI0039E70502
MKINFTQKATLLLLLLGTASFAQNGRKVFGKNVESINPVNGKIRCVSSEYEKSLQEKYPQRASSQEFENWIAPKVAQVKQQMASARGIDAVVTIPVVVHVIHNGDAVGSNENISDVRVQSQITVLNQDFRKMLGTPGYNTNAVGADVEIQFCLAQRKPDGTATNGINRVQRTPASYASESSVETMKAATQWDPTQYFNIWVVYFSDSSSAEMYGVLGYAQFPSNSGLGGMAPNGGSANTDGVVIDYRCFGTSTLAPSSNYFDDYDKGRTATHEIGHCFGLIHIWGDNGSCTVNATDSAKDFCPDTPAQAEEHYDCTSTYNTCPSAPGNDMTANYMDYTNDTCMNIFTLDQKARILAVLQNSPRRSTLPASLGCQPPSLGTSSFELLERHEPVSESGQPIRNTEHANRKRFA